MRNSLVLLGVTPFLLFFILTVESIRFFRIFSLNHQMSLKSTVLIFNCYFRFLEQGTKKKLVVYKSLSIDTEYWQWSPKVTKILKKKYWNYIYAKITVIIGDLHLLELVRIEAFRNFWNLFEPRAILDFSLVWIRML